MKNNFRPSIIDSIDSLNNYYWLKKDLVGFCQKNKLSAQGSKHEIMQRISEFFKGIEQPKVAKKLKVERDSRFEINIDTLVVNYKNDVKTREFFISQIGEHFKFNIYLRQFTDKDNILPNMTYGDLASGWVLFEKEKAKNKASNKIPKQFEYNRFIKEYFENERNSDFKCAIDAWNIVKSHRGPNTYQEYKKL